MWICVHDHVFGGKSRKLANVIGCSQDEAVGLLVRLWVWGLTNCDRAGLVQFADRSTIADVLVQGLSKELKPDDIVDALIECEYLDTDGGTIYIHDWADWQKYWYSYQDRKKNNADSKRKSRGEGDDKKPKRPKPKPAGKEDYTPEFERFWKVYPRKINKIDAFAKYNVRVSEGYSDSLLYAAAESYAKYVKKAKKDKEHILHPETFLGASLRFKDYLPDEIDEAPDTPKADPAANPFEKYRDMEGGRTDEQRS